MLRVRLRSFVPHASHPPSFVRSQRRHGSSLPHFTPPLPKICGHDIPGTRAKFYKYRSETCCGLPRPRTNTCPSLGQPTQQPHTHTPAPTPRANAYRDLMMRGNGFHWVLLLVHSVPVLWWGWMVWFAVNSPTDCPSSQ